MKKISLIALISAFFALSACTGNQNRNRMNDDPYNDQDEFRQNMDTLDTMRDNRNDMRNNRLDSADGTSPEQKVK
ncbi:MAG TPA: hypothetical protein VK102_10710 [Sphingobacterium sp.]|nr:hypothetical protein [Sphingobacterium sp.]